jgi:hypothetical protein
VIELLREGLESAFLPCSFILLIPGLAVGLGARTKESSWALLGFAIGAIATAWLRYSDRISDVGTNLPAIALAVALAFIAVPIVRRFDAVAAAGGVLAGSAAALLWEPCVGAEFGTLLGEMPGAGPGSALRLAAYLVGVLAPLIVVGGLIAAIPSPALLPARPFMLASSVVVLAGLAIGTALGFHDDLVGQLVQWSL